MDLNSLNSGTTDTKGWLNPVVGDLKAKSVGSASYQITDEDSNDTVQLGGGIYRRAAGTSPVITISTIAAPPFGPGLIDIANLGTSEGDIPISALVGGCAYELYIAGRFTNSTPASISGIYMSPSFTATQPTDFPDRITELIVDNGAIGDVQGFELRLTFRIVAHSDTTVVLEASANTMSNRGLVPSIFRTLNNLTTLTVNTPSRSASVTKRFPFGVWCRTDANSVVMTRTQLYLRRIS